MTYTIKSTFEKIKGGVSMGKGARKMDNTKWHPLFTKYVQKGFAL